MNEATPDFLDPDLLKDAEQTAQRAALSGSDEALPTSRLPPLTPPPMPNIPTVGAAPLPASFAQPTMGAAASQSLPPYTAPSFSEGTTRYRSEPPPPAKPSWLRALLTTTFPPPANTTAESDAHVMHRAAGAACVVLGLVFAVVALVTGLRGAPSDTSLAPVVAAAFVLARAFVALGAGAFSFGCFRMAERLLAPPRSTEPRA